MITSGTPSRVSFFGDGNLLGTGAAVSCGSSSSSRLRCALDELLHAPSPPSKSPTPKTTSTPFATAKAQ